jgi:molecular chaperone GrpE
MEEGVKKAQEENKTDQEMNDRAESESESRAELEAGGTVEEKLAAALQEIAELRDRSLRAAAEFDNSKKRMERDRMAALKYAGEPVLREMLPVVDNLERALTQGVVAEAGAEKNLAALLEGVQLTLKGLLVSLEKFEVKAIESIGQPFNPNIHEALVMEPSDTAPASYVLKEFEKGYQHKDRLLRVAKVIVSSGKAGA